MTAAAAMSREEIIAFLDDYRLGESRGSALFRDWAAVCKDATLRGTLRMATLREQSHAQLLEQRLRELGGTPLAQPTDELADFYAFMRSPTSSDAAKLRKFVSMAPPDKIVNYFNGYADRMDADPESQGLLRAIIADERATLEALQAFDVSFSGTASAA